MIQIYSPQNTNFDKNGDMTLLPDAATVHPILNGEWEVTMHHPIDEEGRWKCIISDAVVKMPSFNGEQLFRIKKTEKEDGGITVELQPIFMDARDDCFLKDVRPTEKNGQEALDLMTASNIKYAGESDIIETSTAYYELKNLMEAIAGEDENSFINRWGGEILFDNFKVIVNQRIGGDYGVEVRYGKNIPENGFVEEIDMRDVVTRIVPKAYNGRMIEGDQPWEDSEQISKYPTIRYGVMEFEDIKLREDAQEDEDEGVTICSTQKELELALRARCREQYDSGVDKPKVTLSVDMVMLENTDLYQDIKELEMVSLGDTIHCRHSKLDIITDARVIELEWDCLKKRVTSVVLGEFQYNYMNDVESMINRIESAIRADGSVVGQQVRGILDGVKTQMKAQSSIAKKSKVRAILMEDLDPQSETFGAMCIGTMGFEIASKRTTDGRDWDWRTFGTGAGFFADFIAAGTMLADRIKGGTLVLGGEGNGNGIAKIVDAAGNEIVRLDNNGVYAKGSYVCESSPGWNRRIEMKDGSIMFSRLDGSGRMFFETGAAGLTIRSGGVFGDATESKTLMRVFEDEIYFDAKTVGPDGVEGVSGKAEFSDGTYLEFKKGFLTGGYTKGGAI